MGAISAAAIAAAATIGSTLLAPKPATDKDTRTSTIQQQLEQALGHSLTAEEAASFSQVLGTQLTSGTGSESTNEIGSSATSGTENVSSSQTGREGTTSANTNTLTRGTDSGRATLDSIIGGGANINGGAAVDAAIARVLQSGAPVVAAAGNRAGAFDSTVGAQLQNDLITKAGQAGATVDLQQKNTNLDRILQAITSGQAGTEVTTGTGIQDVLSSNVGSQAASTANTSTTNNAANTSTANTQNVSTDQTTAGQQTTNGASTTQQTNANTTIGDDFTDVDNKGSITRPDANTALSGIIAGNNLIPNDLSILSGVPGTAGTGFGLGGVDFGNGFASGVPLPTIDPTTGVVTPTVDPNAVDVNAIMGDPTSSPFAPSTDLSAILGGIPSDPASLASIMAGQTPPILPEELL